MLYPVCINIECFHFKFPPLFFLMFKNQYYQSIYLYIKQPIITRNNVKLTRISFPKYSQQELAKEIGVSRQTMNLIETEKYNPFIKICLLLCKALGANLDDLFWYENMK
ncbi:helix-turn-helix transcriptional regulator [Oceanobacillus sp. FSL W7-1281]|uniref:helix-turn-helix transcriptional regulator n=1 Tax=Oceanobacillus sp. FSL W7-1281 TaxID=2921698 RepID=UPI0030DC92A5